MNEHPRLFKAHPRNGDPAMTADDFMTHMPPHVRHEFLTWLTKRDRKIGLREFRSGYDHGWHDGQASNTRIA